MSRSVFSSSRKYAAFALAVVLALGAVAFYFTRQQPVPVTGAANVVRAPAVSAPNANVAPSQAQPIYLGQGYSLVTRPDGAQVVVNSNPVKDSSNAPARNVNVAPNLGQRIYLGNGTFLITHPDGSQEISPSNSVENRPNAVKPDQVIYLGNWTYLIIHPDGSREISPTSPLNDIPSAPASNVSSSGDGKLLTILPDGLQIMAGGTAPKMSVAPNPGQRIYLGNGTFMIIHPDGSQEITQ